MTQPFETPQPWHPFQSVPINRRAGLFLAFLALALVLTAVLQIVDVPLRTGAAPYGIVSYELAASVVTAREILATWNANARMYAAFSLGLDFLYMPAYAVAIALACAWLAGMPGMTRVFAWTGVLLAWGQGLAVLCDATENLSLIAMLFSAPAAPWPQIALVCAIVKFALVTLGLLYALAGALIWLARRSR